MKDKLMRFFSRRYGHDQLNYFLLVLSLVFLLLIFLTQSSIFVLLEYLCLFGCLLRSFSSNHYQRSQENEKFLQLCFPVTQRYKAFIKNRKDKERKYFVCPKCHQLSRVPRKKGKIEITCPHCYHHFSRRT